MSRHATIGSVIERGAACTGELLLPRSDDQALDGLAGEEPTAADRTWVVARPWPCERVRLSPP